MTSPRDPHPVVGTDISGVRVDLHELAKALVAPAFARKEYVRVIEAQVGETLRRVVENLWRRPLVPLLPPSDDSDE